MMTVFRRLAFAALALALLTSFAPVSVEAQPAPQNSLLLVWTASGDDGMEGRSSSYDLRYSATPPSGMDTTSWWNSASRAGDVPVPGASGSSDSTRVTGLAPATRYYFVIRARDESGNVSGFSNVATGATADDPFPPPPPGCSPPGSAPSSLAVAIEGKDAVLTWAATSDPSAASVHIWRATGASGVLTLVATIASSNTSYRDRELTGGVTYRYRATFASSCGSDGPPTSSLLVSIPSRPGGPKKGPKVVAMPNPSRGPVRLGFQVPGASSQPVRLRLFDLTGHWVADLTDATFPPGDHEIVWNRLSRAGGRVAPGYYVAVGTIAGSSVKKHIVLLP